MKTKSSWRILQIQIQAKCLEQAIVSVVLLSQSDKISLGFKLWRVTMKNFLGSRYITNIADERVL